MHKNKSFTMCNHYDNDVAYCISCKDTICIDCLRDKKSCKKCSCLFNMKCNRCERECHSDSYICDFCDYKCCKLCLKIQLEKSINDLVCPNSKCNELLVFSSIIKMLGFSWFDNDYKKYKKRTLCDIAMLKKSDEKIECKLCLGMCIKSNKVVKCTKQDVIYDINTMEEYDPVFLAFNEQLKPNIKKTHDEFLDEYNKCLEEEPKLNKYRDRIEIDLFKNHKARLRYRELIEILVELNNLGYNNYHGFSKLNTRLELFEKRMKIKCFRIDLKTGNII